MVGRTTECVKIQTSHEDIRNILNDLESEGDICAGGEADMPTLPGLYLEGVGEVAVPLNKLQASALAESVKQGPYGLEKIASWNTLEIDSNRVSFENPNWNKKLNKIVHRAAEELGVTPTSVSPSP